MTDAVSYGATGPVARGVGLRYDLRLSRSTTYSNYWHLSLRSFLGKRGDSYDRFLVRMREMYESISIVFQVLSNFSNIRLSKEKGAQFSLIDLLHTIRSQKLSRKTKYTSMEHLILHFKEYSEGIKVPRGFTYQAVEAPEGRIWCLFNFRWLLYPISV